MERFFRISTVMCAILEKPVSPGWRRRRSTMRCGDLRARLLDVPLVNLFGMVRDGIPVYGSGGFTSYNDSQLQHQLGGWAQDGFSMVKMKVGSNPEDDPRGLRSRAARSAINANSLLTPMERIQLHRPFVWRTDSPSKKSDGLKSRSAPTISLGS